MEKKDDIEVSDFDEEEYRKAIKEYEQRLLEEDEYDDEFRDLNSGIYALDRTFTWDKNVEGLVDIFYRAISFIESHTELTQDEIINLINSKINEVELVNGYEENPEGVGYVDNIFGVLSINENILREDNETVYEFITHEIVHMLSGIKVKRFWQNRPIIISGYSKEDTFDFESETVKSENRFFNEAVVEMFVYQDEEFRKEQLYGYTVYTNQDLNGGLYCINSNIIRQMMIARGIGKDTLFKGLYDIKTASRVEKKFNKESFSQLSRNMDNISNKILEYWQLKNSEEDGMENQELDKKIETKRQEILRQIQESERIVIDKILMPRLKRLHPEEREALLEEYEKFIVCEGEYFRRRTGYKAIYDLNKVEKQVNKFSLPKVNIDFGAVLKRMNEKDIENKPNSHPKEDR